MEAYENEKSAIMRRSRDVEREMKELADKYASLLGHQNTRQKIRHVEKLKEDNIKLKQVGTCGNWQDLHIHLCVANLSSYTCINQKYKFT